MITVATVNRKGGVGKSVTSSAIFSWCMRFLSGRSSKKFSKKSSMKKALLIDLDSQCNVSYAFGIDVMASPDILTIANVFAGECSLNEAIIEKSKCGFIVPANENLVDYDNGTEAFKVDLKSALESVSKEYDFCIIDAPPSLGRLTISALLASDYVIIPAQADIYSVQGLNSMVKILQSVQQHNKIKVAGILLTRNNERLLLTKAITDLIEDIAKRLNTRIFKTSIREGVVVREASAQQVGLFDYDVNLKSNVAKDYDAFIRELLEVIENDK